MPTDTRAEIELQVRATPISRDGLLVVGSILNDRAVTRLVDLILEHRAQESERAARNELDRLSEAALKDRARELRAQMKK